MPELYRTADIEWWDAGEGRRFLLAGGGDAAPATVAEEDVRLLGACVSYRTLDEHAAECARRLELAPVEKLKQGGPRWLSAALGRAEGAFAPSKDRVAEVRGRLEEFARRGWMLRRGALAEECRAAANATPPAPVRVLGFTTRRRPAELARALASYAENFRRYGRAPEIVVVDDSRNPADEAATIEVLAAFARASGLNVRFAGLREREAYARMLAGEARVPKAIARFALLGDARCPVTTGSARNALLLDAVGAGYVLADDDGLCRLARPPDAREGFALSSRPDPTETWFYPGREALQAATRFEDADLLGLHESLLGREAGLLAAEAADAGALVLDEASAAFEARLRRQGARVRTSMAGIVGDSGVGSTAYLTVGPESRRRLTTSEAFYRAAVENRQSLRAPPRPSLGDGFLCMAGNLGLDAAETLPPFVPVQRNSDGLLGRLLQTCFPRACLGYLGWAVAHDPVETRVQTLEAFFEQARRVRFADVATAFFPERGGANRPVAAASENLRTLGRALAEAAAAGPRAFAADLRRRLLARESQRLTRGLRTAGDAPRFYAELQTRYRETIRGALTTDAYIAPRDLGGDGAERAALELARELVGDTGRLLEAWPALWNAADWLRRTGRRVSRPV